MPLQVKILMLSNRELEINPQSSPKHSITLIALGLIENRTGENNQLDNVMFPFHRCIHFLTSSITFSKN